MAENPSSAELQPWIARANRIEAEVSEYARLAGEWKPCGEGPFSDGDAENVRNAVARYQHEYRNEIDYVLENSNREMKSEGADKDEGKPGFEMGSRTARRRDLRVDPAGQCLAHRTHRCETTNVTIYREKPPGGAWTSWRLAVGGGEELDCSKF